MENISYTVLLIIVAGIFGMLITAITIYFCIRHLCPSKYKKAPTIVTNGIQIDKKNGLIIKMAESDDSEKFFGLSLNDIPFIDDSKYNSHIDLSRNPYQPLTNTA